MPACHNCGNTDQFELLVDLAVTHDPVSGFHDPGWELSLQCTDCASTDVAGDAVALLADYL